LDSSCHEAKDHGDDDEGGEDDPETLQCQMNGRSGDTMCPDLVACSKTLSTMGVGGNEVALSVDVTGGGPMAAQNVRIAGAGGKVLALPVMVGLMVGRGTLDAISVAVLKISSMTVMDISVLLWMLAKNLYG